MKAWSGMLALAIFFWPVLLAPATQAEVLDLSTIKCKAFFESSKETVSHALAWLDGYYKDEEDPAVIDFDKLKDNAKMLGDYCAAHPGETVGTAGEQLFGK
jgi:acid stress chaperone HdeB